MCYLFWVQPDRQFHFQSPEEDKNSGMFSTRPNQHVTLQKKTYPHIGLKQQQNILFISTERPRHPWLFIVTGTKSAFFPSQLSASINISLASHCFSLLKLSASINISLAKSLASISIPDGSAQPKSSCLSKEC